MNTRIGALSSTCLFVAVFAGNALAQSNGGAAGVAEPRAESTEQTRKEAAKQHFLSGLEFARADQNWDAALAEFLASRELFPTQVALLNAAISLTRLGRYDEALQMYAELHQLFDASMTAQEKQLVDEEVAGLKSRVGELELVISEPGTQVELDGRVKGETPLARPISVAPGTHVLRLTKVGFDRHEVRLVVASQQKRRLEIVLQRSPAPAPVATAPASGAKPSAKQASLPRSERDATPFYLAAAVGVFVAPSLGGGATSSCAESQQHDGMTLPGCRDRSRPLGPLVSVALGYEVASALNVELGLGYLRTGERLTRSLVATGDLGRRYVTTDELDETDLSAFAATLGVGHRFRWPVSIDARLRLGVARATLAQRNSGRFAISVSNPKDANDVYSGEQRVSVPEQASTTLLPLVSPELRFGWQISPRFSLDLGAALLVLFGSSDSRTGATSLSGEGQRRTALDDVPAGYADGTAVRPGVIALPEERRLGTIFAVSPTLGARVEL